MTHPKWERSHVLVKWQKHMQNSANRTQFKRTRGGHKVRPSGGQENIWIPSVCLKSIVSMVGVADLET